MCLLLALWRPGTGELWVAANRDERLDRPWVPPARLLETPRVWGGRDLLAGGTWLALNLDAGFVVGVTNARLGAPPGARSRGTLVMEVAAQPSAEAARACLGGLDLSRYGPFNLLVASRTGFFVTTNEPASWSLAVDGEIVVLGNDPLDAPSERVVAAGECGRMLVDWPPEMRHAGLRRLLADHGGADPICRHGDRYGTVCATLLWLGPGGARSYEFAPGPPCVTPFARVSLEGAA